MRLSVLCLISLALYCPVSFSAQAPARQPLIYKINPEDKAARRAATQAVQQYGGKIIRVQPIRQKQRIIHFRIRMLLPNGRVKQVEVEPPEGQ